MDANNEEAINNQLLLARIEAANVRIQELEHERNNLPRRPPPAAALGRAPSPDVEPILDIPAPYYPVQQQLDRPIPQQMAQHVQMAPPMPQQMAPMPPPMRGPLNHVLPPAGPPNNPDPGYIPDRGYVMEAPAGVPMGLGDIQQAIMNAASGMPPTSNTEQSEPFSRYFALGATLDMRTKTRIWSGQYIDLPSLVSAVGRHGLTVNMDGGQPTLSLATPRTEPVEHIWAWVRLFFTYAAIYSERKPQDAPGLFTYAVRILDLQRRYRGTMWRAYDERFRSLKAYCPQLPWHTINWDLANELIGEMATPNLAPAAKPRADQPQQGNEAGPPRGACRDYFRSGTCDRPRCHYVHLCGKCKKPGHSKLQCNAGAPPAKEGL